MANQILAGAVFQAGQVIAGVDANNPPYVGPPVGKFITRSISGGYPKTISLRSVIDIDADPITTITNTSSYFGTRFASDPNGRYLAIGDTVNNKVFVYNTQDLGADPTVVDYPSSGSAAVLSMNSDKLFVGKTTIYAYDLSDLSAAPTTISAPSSEVADYGFGSDIACNSTHLFIGSQYARIDQQGGVQSSGADSESGKVHVWNISTEQYEIDLYGTDVEYGDKFGSEIKVTDTHVAIGAYGADTSPGYQPETGAVYLFDAQDLSATPTKLTGGGYGDEYGRNIDLNSTHLAVSEGNYSGYSDTGASLQENGRLFIYSLTNLSNPTIKTGNLYSEKYGINPNLFKDGSGRISFYRSLANTGGPTKYFVYNINDLDTPLWESETEQPVMELPAYVAPLTSVAGTSLLLSGNNASIRDESQSVESISVFGNTTVADSSPYGTGKSISFDGDGDYIRADEALDSFTSTTDPFTIEFWMRPERFNDGSAVDIPFAINSISTGSNELILVGNNNGAPSGQGQYVTLSGSGANPSYSLGLNLQDNGPWYHIAMTYDGTTFKLYVDGTVAISQNVAFTIPFADCSLLIGADADSANAGSLGNYYKGALADIRISKEVAYTENFTVPSASLGDYSENELD
jgi:hypothetical protein